MGGNTDAGIKQLPDGNRGWIWDIKKYALHDGPGIRTTVFFKGCPLCCLWCCNPESQSFDPEITWLAERCLGCGRCEQVCPKGAIVIDPDGRRRIDPEQCDRCGCCVEECPAEALTMWGRMVTGDEVLQEVTKDAIYYQRSGGGLTLSGGEPLAQPGFAVELLRRYKTEEFGLHTAVETCGHVDWSYLARAMRYTDLFLYDLKHMDSFEHRHLTGVGNRLILENALRLARAGAGLVIRLPLIPGCNNGLENIRRTAEFVNSLPGVARVDLLPYHRLGEPKYHRLDREYLLTGTRPLTEDDLAGIQRIFEEYGLEAGVGG